MTDSTRGLLTPFPAQARLRPEDWRDARQDVEEALGLLGQLALEVGDEADVLAIGRALLRLSELWPEVTGQK
jgi:hypothetical protein